MEVPAATDPRFVGVRRAESRSQRPPSPPSDDRWPLERFFEALAAFMAQHGQRSPPNDLHGQLSDTRGTSLWMERLRERRDQRLSGEVVEPLRKP